jgi:hypothetical protein
LRPPTGGFGGGSFRSGGSGGNARSAASQIESWVSSHFKSTTVGGVTMYDLTQPKASAR